MADVKMTPVGARGEKTDRFLVCEGMPGIKKVSIRLINNAGEETVYLKEFPQIGQSLPAIIDFNNPYMNHNVFTSGNVKIADSIQIDVSIIEYDGQPDVDYFNITGINDNGMPIYAKS